MEIKNYFAQDAQGNIMPSANCYLYLPGTTTLATGLVDSNGAPISNPFLASNIGQVTFGAPNGVYDLRISQGARDTTIEIQCADLLQAMNETASFLGAHSVPPASGNSGEPLQIYYRYFNTVDQLEYLYKSTGWVANNLDGQLLATSQGASLIGAVMQDGSIGTIQDSIDIGDSSLRQALADPAQGARMLAYLERSVYEKLSDFICITDHYRTGDGGQWHQAYARAIAVSPRVRFPFRADIKYEFGVTQSLPDNAIILADPGAVLHSPEATNAAGTAMLRIFNTTGGRNIGLIGVKFDGGVREVQTAKSYVRPVEFKNCENVVAINCEIVNNPDWSMSFEGCTNVVVSAYKQRSYVYADDATTRAISGGRDGLHFMDCTNVYADDLDIESGDDCVGITSRDTGCANINIGNIRGSSVIASPVIYNEEQVSGSYVAKPMVGLHIKGVRVKSGATVRNVVRVIKYNPLSTIKDVTVSDVTGQSSNHGVHLSGVDEGSLDEINTVSTGQHGVYLSQCSSITGSARGKSLLAGFDGVQINGCKNMNFVTLSTGAANYGMHLIAVTDSVITPVVTDCGGVAFASGSGGNGRMVNCVGVEIPNGILSGASDTSYYGLQESGNTDCRVGAGVKARGFINRQGARNPTSVFQEPTVAVRFSESGGALTVSAALGCSVTLVSLGVYKITFNTPMRSTNFNYQAFASSVGAVRNIKQVSAALVGEVTISTVDAAGAVAASIVSFLAYDS